MAERTLFELFRGLNPDDRQTLGGFSPELEAANKSLWQTASVEDQKCILKTWISRYQPCLFGRVAAKRDSITFCILNESDIIEHDDLWIRDTIQNAHLEWYRRGHRGQSSNFILAVISSTLAYSVPNEASLEFAKRLCSLYLIRDEIDANTVYHDRIYLTAGPELAWEWLAGVNYFSAAGDRRWWHDHRFPGGIAFSTNSVGHMVKSAALQEANVQFAKALDVEEPDGDEGYVKSLADALAWAMRTIANAQVGPYGKATSLCPVGEDLAGCPEALPQYLKGYDHRSYKGLYHTDYTLPSSYFRVDAMPREEDAYELDFSYLFDRSIANPDYVTMGAGRRIMADQELRAGDKTARVLGRQVPLHSSPSLVQALKG